MTSRDGNDCQDRYSGSATDGGHLYGETTADMFALEVDSGVHGGGKGSKGQLRPKNR